MVRPLHSPLLSIFKKSIVLSFILLFVNATLSYGQIFVDTDAAGANDGTTWADAYTNLQDAIDNAGGSDQIWIAEGTYYPDEGASQTQDDRLASFTISGFIDGVKIYGGFDGTESSLGDRDLSAHETILSGDIDQDGTLANNSYHVVSFLGHVNKPPVADFSVISPNAVFSDINFTNNSTDPDGSIVSYNWDFDDGGTSTLENPTTTYSSPGVYYVSLTVTDNKGATDKATRELRVQSGINIGRSPAPSQTNQIMASSTNSPVTTSTVLSDVTITGGNAEGTGFNADGGGMVCDANGTICSPKLVNIIFANNHADVEGGAIFNNGYGSGDSSPTIINSVFVNNTGGKNAGAMFNAGAGSGSKSSPTITNSTFYGNSAGYRDGGAILNNGINGGQSDPQIINTIFFGNSAGRYGDQVYNRSGGDPTISHSLIDGSGGSGGSWDSSLGTDAGGNLDTGPQFKSISNPNGSDNRFGTSDDGLTLQSNSPAINAGDNTATTLSKDITGANRVLNSTVDLGAYESAFSTSASPSSVIHVDVSATGANNGTTWADAYTNLQDALAGATSGNQIWIAEGTYYPTSGTDRDLSFTVSGPQDGLEIYGGFNGTETTLSQRDADANIVILSGDIGTTGDASDNSYHVFLFDGRTSGSNITPSTRLEGVTIQGGNASDGSTFRNSFGGGIFCNGSTSGNICSPTLADIIFSGNKALNSGGALSNDGGFSGESSPVISGCIFNGNSATTGGAISNVAFNGGTSSPTINNKTAFLSNQATTGGAIFNNGAGGTSSPTLNTVIFLNNMATNGGAIFNDATNNGVSSPLISNAAFINNTSGSSSGNGGAINNTSGSASDPGGVSSPILTNIVFRDNSAGTDGGAIFNDGRNGGNSSPQITNALFINNSTNNGNGGALYSNGSGSGTSSPLVTNATFFGNTSGADGGAIVSDLFNSGGTDSPGTAKTTLVNSILFGNDATNGGDHIYNRGSSALSTVSYSLVVPGSNGIVNASGSTTNYKDENGTNVAFASSTNIQGDPMFVDMADPDGPDNALSSADDGFNLQATSPAIGAGNSKAANLPEQDITLRERIRGTEVDLGAYEGPLTLTITGSEGWRMMTAPGDGLSYTDLLEPMWLQGLTGGDVTNGTPNLYTWDEATQKFQAVSDASNVPAAGQGFIAYVYEDDNYQADGLQGGFPKVLQANKARNSGSVSPSLSYNDDGDPGTANDGFNLVGNPYGATIDWDNSGVNKTNLNASIYIWDSSAGGGAGAYLTWNGATGTLSTKGLIAPWQGFWVQANGASPSLEFTDPSRSAGGVFYGAPGSSSDDQPVPQVKFSLEECTAERCSAKPAGQRPALQSRAIVMFSPEAATGRDRLDAVKLQSLNADYLSLYSNSTEGEALDINALPLADSLQAAMNVDMNLKGSALGGAYTLSWTPKDLPTGWSATLKDAYTDQSVDLSQNGDYTFSVANKVESTPTAVGMASTLSKPTGGALPAVLKGKVTNPRFTLTFAPAKAPGREIPQALSISEAYPNPFRSRCNIELGLPEKTPVHVVVYDILGRKVATVADKEMSAGYHTLTMDADRMGIASGVYLCRLKIGTKTKTMKMTFIK